MSPWLTFVVGIIVGLLIGWVIDLVFRRRTDAARDPEQIEPELTPSDRSPPDGASVEAAGTASTAEPLEVAASEVESTVER